MVEWRHVAYGAATLCISMLHNIFLLYHVQTFLRAYRLGQTSFWWGELLFLVWNSVNDFVCGWISDANDLAQAQPRAAHARVTEDTIARRIRALSLGGPGFALSFMLFWFQWAPPGIQFAICLCVYDGFLTFLDINHAALLADMAVTERDRTDMNMYTSVFSAAGSLSVFVSFAVWSSADLAPFQLFCGVLAVIATGGFVGIAQILRAQAPTKGHERIDSLDRKAIQGVDHPSWWMFLRQVWRNPNFGYFTVLNVVQVFHCHFNSNFFPLLLDVLLDGYLSDQGKSLLLGFSFIMPHINNIYFSHLVKQHGIHRIISLLLSSKLILGVVLFVAGPDHPLLLCAFIASNRIFTEVLHMALANCSTLSSVSWLMRTLSLTSESMRSLRWFLVPARSSASPVRRWLL
eukprot:m.105672 g.105672  ORF g.105672 m.105672 type:complete len:404 (+) comp9154_c0_seq3:98-1309(+)